MTTNPGFIVDENIVVDESDKIQNETKHISNNQAKGEINKNNVDFNGEIPKEVYRKLNGEFYIESNDFANTASEDGTTVINEAKKGSNVGGTVVANKFTVCDVPDKNIERIYSYGEAIDLAGNGWYNFWLLVVLSMALLSMALDMFSFAVVVTLSSSDLELTSFRKNVLVSMPFVGPILMSYAWGYISDTRGRKSSLMVALTVGFILSTLGAFSPHWSLLAISRFMSTCFCSCAQSATITLIGESCPERVKGAYMLIMTSCIHLNLALYYPVTYLITRLEFTLDLGFIEFVPWRLLVIVLALPLGASALCLIFFYESPKFLLNAGREKEALDILKNIFRRNGGDPDDYPVKKVVLMECGNTRSDGGEWFFQSLWRQTYPLFKPPLLWKTLMIYYLLFALYTANSGLLVWLPFLAQSFSTGIDSPSNHTQGLCVMIGSHSSIENGPRVGEKTSDKVDIPIVVIAICAGCCYCFSNMFLSLFATYKRIVLITVYSICGFCGIGCLYIHHNLTGVIMYFGIVLNSINCGVVLSYCVDLYPTSFRGMAACLGVMVARLSGIIGVNAIGPFICSECRPTFGALSLLMFSAAAMSYFLPKDHPPEKKKKTSA